MVTIRSSARYNIRPLRFVAAVLMAGSLVACFQAQNANLPPPAPLSLTPLGSATAHAENERAKPPRYTIVDLGTLGGSFSQGISVNDRGWVVGTSTLTGDQMEHEFLWRDGKMTDVGSSFGSLNSLASDGAGINREGTLTGILDTSTPDPNGEDFCGIGDHNICLPFVWRKGTAALLPLPGGNNGATNELNNRGEIVGTGEAGQPDSSCVPPQVLDQVAVVWGPRRNDIRQLPPYGDDTEAAAIGINDKGEVVGTSGKCQYFNQSFGSIEAILWRNGRPINLGNLGFNLFNIAFSINNRSEITGQASMSETSGSFHVFHAYLWRHGVMKDLGSLPGYPFSLGNVINDKTQIVGIAQTASASRGFLWQHGAMYDINALIPKGANFNVIAAEGLNDRGQIAGWGIPGSGSSVHAFVATPCDAENPDIMGCQDARGASRSIVLPAQVRRTIMRWNALHGIRRPAKL